jgi:hypothetical protein
VECRLNGSPSLAEFDELFAKFSSFRAPLRRGEQALAHLAALDDQQPARRTVSAAPLNLSIRRDLRFALPDSDVKRDGALRHSRADSASGTGTGRLWTIVRRA